MATQNGLEGRIAALEKQVAHLTATLAGRLGKYDWRQTIGMFTDNPDMLELFADAIKIREADRKQTRRRQKAGARAKS